MKTVICGMALEPSKVEMSADLADVLTEASKAGIPWIQTMVVCAAAGVKAAADGTLLRLMATNMDKCSLPN